MEISSGIQANKLLLIALLVSAATAVPSKCIIFKFGAYKSASRMVQKLEGGGAGSQLSALSDRSEAYNYS